MTKKNEPKREWYALGATDFKPIPINATTQQHILIELSTYDIYIDRTRATRTQLLAELGKHRINKDLTNDTREQLLTEFRRLGIPVDGPTGFFTEISTAIGLYNAQQQLANDTSPSAARDQMTETLAAATQLSNALGNTNANAIAHIHEALISTGAEQTSATAFINSAIHTLDKINSVFAEAIQLSEEHINQGRLSDIARILLACDLAKIFQKYTRLKPKASEDGPYEALLSIVVGAATGGTLFSSHKLARKALQRLNKKGP